MDLYCHLHPCSPPARPLDLSCPPCLLSAECAALFSSRHRGQMHRHKITQTLNAS